MTLVKPLLALLVTLGLIVVIPMLVEASEPQSMRLGESGTIRDVEIEALDLSEMQCVGKSKDGTQYFIAFGQGGTKVFKDEPKLDD